MISEAAAVPNDELDRHVDEEIKNCLDPRAPRSFFLFAGAGSGKTRSLVGALDHLRDTAGARLRIRGQKVAVITYTKAARDEIIRRTQFDPIIAVSTIHSFAWTLIEGFNHDIREWLRVSLQADIEDLQAKEAKGRAGTKTSAGRIADIASKTRRLARLDTTKTFIYSPDGDNRGRGSLNHAEVLHLAGDFLKSKPVLRHILRDGYPYILVDESQDTNRHIVEALFTFQAAHKDEVVVGLFGDLMQRIYGDGHPGLGENLPSDWATPTKRLNFRCPRRVIELINKIRESTDQQTQIPRSAAIEGHVRMYVLPSEGIDKVAAEKAICTHMAGLTADQEWLDEDAVKVLILEHRMAALRMGFDDLLAALYPVTQFRTSLLDGSLPVVNLFSNLILPLWDAKDDKFGTTRIMRAASPLLSPSALKHAQDQFEQLGRAQAAVDALIELLDSNPSVTFGEVLHNVAKTGIFAIPDMLNVALAAATAEANDAEDKQERSDRDKAIAEFLTTPFLQVRAYAKYVSGKARFDTHQGVKGLEFPRVMVVMDDHEARGFLFKYEKLFGGGADDSQTASTRRLFYVTCSRAQRSLALVAYASNPARVGDQLLITGWFKPEEVLIGLP
ncbi:UvrD-helicase domain-containing protein [Xanthomonas arboricola pv. juglandis]|uniref:DNA 3'-5' helicase II n=2 Tax=Xanthomonas arboricola TaxID=56448 RepID=A0A2N7UYZ2_XANCJ|nr:MULTISPECIES: UvrD-helicase domain-containing protein [Xanthomonas]AKU48389.1 Fis family transcriptional regulator [Xanthomonas arboricola pv. juglandis]KOA96822.1 Fis family transcriptional regulator [Xanthomonas arboricola]KOA96912.1 Fis family transcriptional regulator [Xanthomonas arboricola]KOB05372.1 Fis family transcriptional regulator [Xanthomonas arboricola]KOB09729.1 Fis family transcriptional regulator [Xanthomonas arboricola]